MESAVDNSAQQSCICRAFSVLYSLSTKLCTVVKNDCLSHSRTMINVDQPVHMCNMLPSLFAT